MTVGNHLMTGVRTSAGDPRSLPPASNDQLARARIVLPERPGPIRSLVGGGRRATIYNFASRKTGRPQPGETLGEKLAIERSEAATDIIDYQSQPHRLEFVVDGVCRSYIPDLIRLYADGSIEVIEIKKNYDPRRDPAYQSKIDAGSDVYRALGWRFVIMVDQELHNPPTLVANCAAIAHAGHALIDSEMVGAIETLLDANGGRTTLGALEAALGGWPGGRKRSFAAHVRRLVSITLETPLDPDTPVLRACSPTGASNLDEVIG